METSLETAPNISGVPEEIQENIIKDLQSEEADRNATSIQRRVGISVSENEDLAALGYSAIHLRDLTIEIARHLLISNCIIVYGGDLRKEGYTEVFSDLAYQYRSIGNYKNIHFENYFAYPIYCLLNREYELDFKKNRVDIKKVNPPRDLVKDINTYISPSTNEAKFIWAKSLFEMRETMISQTEARILVGGKLFNYLGKIPGIIEEAKLTLSFDKPLYLVGAYGGASKQVILALEGQEFSFLNEGYYQSENFSEFNSYYNDHSDDKINLEDEYSFFKEYSLERLAENNGLSIEENKRLFITPHTSEILYYIFKGLKKIAS